MIAKHTPGPWGVTPAFMASWDIRISNGEQLYFLGASSGIERYEHEANARLIAAAPEMLEAIEYLIDLNQWIESADCESPFFEETLRLRLNTASDLMITAMEKAKGLKHE